VEQIEIASSRMLKKAGGDRLPHGRGSVSTCKQALAILSRAPAPHSETTGSRALENIDSKNTGRVARQQADFCLFQHPPSGAGTARSNGYTFSRRRLRRALEQAAAALQHVLLLASIAVAIGHLALADEAPPLDYQVKAAFLLNFTKFVEWPGTAFTDAHSPLAICILGEDPFGNALDDMVKGEAVHGRELIIRRIRRAPESKACQVLFVASSGRDAAKILAESGPGVLTIGEGDKFLQDGGIIAFVIENRRVRFDIDQRAAMKAMLTLSSRLMMVARNVEQ
jgi:hypothetical protein